MIWTARTYEQLNYNKDGGQKEILSKFGLKYLPRSAEYVLNDEYNIMFINSKDKNWINYLSKDGLILTEQHVSNDPDKLSIVKGRLKKRITFLHYFVNQGSAWSGYSFIGVFELDQEYDWTKDTYPTGKPMIPNLKYKRISDIFELN